MTKHLTDGVDLLLDGWATGRKRRETRLALARQAGFDGDQGFPNTLIRTSGACGGTFEGQMETAKWGT